MSSSQDKNPKKSKRSFIPKLPSFRRKKNNPSPDHVTPSKSATKSKKQKNENSSNTKSSIPKETQTPKEAPSIYKDKSTSQVVDSYNRCLSELKEEEQNGNNQSRVRPALSNINTTSVFTTSTTTTCFINPEYDREVWHLQNQNAKKDAGIHGNHDREINDNINQKRPDSPTHIIPLSPVKTNSYQHIARCSSVTSTLSSGSSLSLSSPGSLTKLIGGPKPYKSVFTDEPRGVKRQGSTPSDLDVTSSCVSVSGSVSSLSPTIDDVATKVTVKSCSVPGLNQYPIVAPVESLSPGVSPKHTHGSSKREGAYTYDSSGWESEDSSKEKTLTRGSYDINSAAQKLPTHNSFVNLNFDLQAAAAASPQINANLRRERQKVLASKAKTAVGQQSQKPVTERQESPSSAGARREEALISLRSAASASSAGPTNNNPECDSRHEALIQPTDTHVSSDSCPALAHRQQAAVRTPRAAALITPQHSTPCSHTNNADQTAGQDQEKSDEVVLTRVRSVTSPVPLKTSRALYALSHIQLSAMRNKLRSESFDSSDLDSLASDDLMCEADNTFLDPSDESNLTQGNSMPGEQGFSPYPNTGKGKRLRNNSIEFLVASFDKRHRHHSTGQSYGPYTTNSPRGNLRSGQAAGRDTILVEASTYRQMVQDLNSMKTALGKLSKMLQDPKALQEMLAVCQPERELDVQTVDNVTQCEQIPTQEEEAQTEYVQDASKVSVTTCEASSQSEGVRKEDRGVQSDVTFTTSDGFSTDSSDGQDVITRGISTKNNSKVSRIKAAFEDYMALHGTYHVQGCKQCEQRFTSEGKQGNADVIIPEGSEVTVNSFLSREGCLSISSSSSCGEEGILREPWRGSSGLDQVTLSPLGNSLSSGDTSDDNVARLDRQKHAKPHRKHVRISDQCSDGSGSGKLKLPSQRGSSLPRMNREKGSSSEEMGEVCSSRLKHPQSRLGMRGGKLVSPRVAHERLSSSDEVTGSGGRMVCRQRNQSDSSHDGSEDSGSLGEKSKLPQMRRPTSRMQRPRQIQRPKTGQQQGRKPDGKVAIDGRSNPTSRLQKPLSLHKGDGRQHQDQGKNVQPQEQQGSLEWQQLQLQQKQDKLHKQHQAAHKQQQENQQRLQNQQQQLQKDQQEKVTANLQKQQEILVEQQQQQFKRQQQLQQHHMWQHQQQKSLELAMPKFSRPQGMITKRSSNVDLTSSQRRSPETVKTTQEMRHSSPDLIDNKLSSSSQHTATVHTQEKQNGTENQKQSSKSRLPALASRLPSSRQTTNGAVKRDVSSPAQTKNTANGIPVHKSKIPSPKSPRRTIPTGNISKLQRVSPPPERRIPSAANSTGSRQAGVQLQCNQNNNPSVAPKGQVHTTFLTTTTTITTTTLPQSSSGSQVSKLPSPVKSNMKPASRLAQPKVKAQSKIPKGSGIPMKSRDAN